MVELMDDDASHGDRLDEALDRAVDLARSRLERLRGLHAHGTSPDEVADQLGTMAAELQDLAADLRTLIGRPWPRS
jgi:nucleotide-binding universal stress UspA family protein